MGKQTILCVDDEVDNVDALKRLLRKDYEVFTATSGAEGLRLLKSQKMDLIISDQRMPSLSGVEFLKQSQTFQPEAVRMLLTGYSDIQTVIEAINEGHIYRYITKPWDSQDLLTVVAQAMEYRQLHLDLKEKNRQLQEALTELQSLDKAKNQFMVLINHELKTPLTSILSFLHLLKESPLTEEQTQFVSRLSQNSVRLQNLINDTLLFMSATTGLRQAQKSNHSVQELLPTLTPYQKQMIQEKNLDLDLHLPSLSAKFDLELCKLVFDRLFENALRFAADKTRIKVYGATDQNNKKKENNIFISIENIGPSISESVLQKILKPFELNEKIMNHTKGVGLGLSIANALVRLYGGELRIRCEALGGQRSGVSQDLPPELPAALPPNSARITAQFSI